MLRRLSLLCLTAFGSSLFAENGPVRYQQAGREALRLDDPASAVALFEQAVADNARDIVSWIGLLSAKLQGSGRSAFLTALDRFRAAVLTGTDEASSLERLAPQERALAHLVTLFVTDEGQKQFLLGKSVAAKGDCPAAMGHFQEAERSEGPHASVWTEKAVCEGKLGLVTARYATLVALDRLLWFDRPSVERLAEAHLDAGQPLEARKVLRRYRESSLGSSGQLSWALADYELGQTAAALPRFLHLVTGPRRGSSAPAPLAYYGAGMLLSEQKNRSAEAATYLRRFLEAAPPKPTTDTADPFRWDERTAAARAALVKLGIPKG